jgi:excisionase family DNA binding protein
MDNGTFDNWITPAEAAELSGYHVNHVRRLVRLGLVKGRKIGPARLIDRRSLLDYLEASQESADGRRGPKNAS